MCVIFADITQQKSIAKEFMSSILPLFLALLAQANINPNVGNKPQLGWGAWQPKSQVEAARFASGFSFTG